jgi:histone-lysine N-methyltransferase SETMAR
MLNRIVTGNKSWVHHYQPKSKRALMQWKHPSSPSTKKFKVTPPAGKVMLCVFLDSREVLSAHFQKCGENVNSASYNARPHTAHATQERIKELQWELLEHPPYNPDLAPSDFHVFGPLKNNLGGKRFADDKQDEMEVRKWLRQQSKDFYALVFNAPVT